MFIEKIETLQVDYTKMREDYIKVLSLALPEGWDQSAILESKQINLRGKDFLPTFNSEDADPKNAKILGEKMFSYWNEGTPKYTRDVIDELCYITGFKLTRARYLCQAPGRGLSVHRDPGVRFHFVMDTNPQSLFFNVKGEPFQNNLDTYHLPVCNHFYRIDTTQDHFVYNAGHTNRVHLVIS